MKFYPNQCNNRIGNNTFEKKLKSKICPMFLGLNLN
ncbi:hypothetical protein SAMN05443549_101105 [Flavobacterium fluvii]|uniref:Uncharacterized protein n=1 Tax=Flavobacterium fluvii TaxID=468056 RepID=A0A1M5DX56_9FLAO|nr:hypothetical protein SAMN05443549_101105 [Flavobacterium fluvii]